MTIARLGRCCPGPAGPQGAPGPAGPTGATGTQPILTIQDFGGRGDGAFDNTPAFNAALAYMAASGRSLYVPAGGYRMASACAAVDMGSSKSRIMIWGDGPASMLLPDAIGTEASLFAFANSGDKIVFKDLGFRGSANPLQVDCGAILNVTLSAGVLLERCAFIALLSASTTLPGLVRADVTPLVITDSEFGGCCHMNGANAYVTRATGTSMIVRTSFVDYYRIDGDAWGKVGPNGGSLAWLWLGKPNPGGVTSDGVVQACMFDEGAAAGVLVGELVTDQRTQRVLIEDCYENVSNSQDGYVVQWTDQVEIRRCASAWAASARPAVRLVDVGQGLVDRCFFLNALKIQADVDTKRLIVKDSVYGSIDSLAPVTSVEFDGVPSQTSFTFTADADQPLTALQSGGANIVVQPGVISVPRKITSTQPPTAGRSTNVVNANAVDVLFAWATGAALTVPAGEARLVGSDGTNAIALGK